MRRRTYDRTNLNKVSRLAVEYTLVLLNIEAKYTESFRPNRYRIIIHILATYICNIIGEIGNFGRFESLIFAQSAYQQVNNDHFTYSIDEHQ